jgi:hypothetical protein
MPGTSRRAEIGEKLSDAIVSERVAIEREFCYRGALCVQLRYHLLGT